MPDAKLASSDRLARYRQRQSDANQKQVQIYLDADLKEAMDTKIKALGFRSRSEYISSLLASNLERVAV